ncbi:hypothetical protein R1flu_012797 [Riccia fluitans]|uniref:Uncharacterized protein n=1 Tax=Riccia fluitans TaxID=41844 RepID=A0ABD1ZBL5_9MARC
MTDTTLPDKSSGFRGDRSSLESGEQHEQYCSGTVAAEGRERKREKCFKVEGQRRSWRGCHFRLGYACFWGNHDEILVV